MAQIPQWISQRIGSEYEIQIRDDSILDCHLIHIKSYATGKFVNKQLPFNDITDFFSRSFNGTMQGAYETLVCGLIEMAIKELEGGKDDKTT